jgi:hypothetical protein
VTRRRQRVGLVIAPLTVAAAVILHAWIDVPRGPVQPRVTKQSKAKKAKTAKKAKPAKPTKAAGTKSAKATAASGARGAPTPASGGAPAAGALDAPVTKDRPRGDFPRSVTSTDR